MFEGKLKTWSEAGLIDDATAARIREWEKANSRPLGLWALIGLGALAIGLGLVSVVAANWDAIPGEARLAIHFALMAALAAFMWWQRKRSATINAHFNDALLFVFGALGVTFFGHLGQVYQTSSPLWQPLSFWLLLFTPLFLGFGRGWLAALLWMGALCLTASQHWDWYLDRYNDAVARMVGEIGGDGRPRVSLSVALYMGVMSSITPVVTAFAAAMRSRSARTDFWRRLEQIALILTVLWFSIGPVFRLLGGSGSQWSFTILAIQSVILIAAGAIVRTARPTPSGLSTAAILVAAGVINPGWYLAGDSSLGNAVLFMMLWAAVAAAALHAGWRIVFQGAVAVLAVRLIILSFELASDLLGSGLGLILAGVATLLIAWIAVRISRRYAPKGAGE